MNLRGQTNKLKDGREVRIRPIRQDEFERSFQFFSELPEEDRMYLRVDVTDAEVVKKRLTQNPLENCFRLVALHEDRIVADATLNWPKYGWMSHVGEIRVIITKDFRRAGLASFLYRKLFVQAVKNNLEKIEVQMMPQQVAARSVVEKLGFKEEGTLTGFVKDKDGNLRDLIVMSVNIATY